jgi:hypothetical protein
VDRIGKTQSRLSNLESSHSAFLRLYAVLTLPLSLPITSYVILLLPQPSDFSPPANLSKPNVGVSTFELTDYISVRLTKLTRRFIIVPSGFINSESFVVCRKAILASPLRWVFSSPRSPFHPQRVDGSFLEHFQAMYFTVQQGANNDSIPTTSAVVTSTLKPATPASSTVSGSASSAAKQSSKPNAAAQNGNSLLAIPASVVMLLASYIFL